MTKKRLFQIAKANHLKNEVAEIQECVDWFRKAGTMDFVGPLSEADELSLTEFVKQADFERNGLIGG